MGSSGLTIRGKIGAILLTLFVLTLGIYGYIHKNSSFLSVSTPITEAPLVDTLPFPDLGGQLIFDTPNGKLWRLQLTPDGERPVGIRSLLFRIPPGTFAFQPVWSPDRTQIAYGHIESAGPEGGLRGANIWRVNANGSAPQVVTKPPDTFTGSYRDPAWAPDGRSIWVTAVVPKGDAQSGVIRIHSEIRRVDVENGHETVIVADGHSPALSPDGTQFAYITTDRETSCNNIWLSPITGEQPRLLVPADPFETIYGPMRFSPDGRYLAFAAADAANLSNAETRFENKGQFLTSLLDLFQPNTLYAHGLYPADVWLVSIETGTLARLTKLAEDHPAPVWSSDGRYLAFAGALGIYIVDVTRQVAVRISDQGMDGQIDWAD